jgi:hypothetical protein
MLLLITFNISYAMDPSNLNITDNPRAYIKNYSSYLDADNNIAIIGSVAKSDYQIYPQNVTVGILAYNNLTASHEIIAEKPYNTILSKNNEPFPFKFKLNSTIFPLAAEGEPFILESENVSMPTTKLNTIKLDYPVIPQGKNKELFGNITNTSPIPINNITLFAIVNDRNSTQIDSVRSFISVLNPYEKVQFSFIPDPAIKDRVYFYSCVGADIDGMKIDEFKIVNISDSKILGYKFSGLIQIDSMNYNSSSKQFNFAINNIYPYPGLLAIELMPVQNSPISIEMDGSPYHATNLKNTDNKTKIELSIPQGIHDVAILNIEDNK